MVERLEAEYDVAVEWRAFELHPETPPEGRQLPSHLRARFDGTFERLRQRAHAAGMEMVRPDIVANSRRALEASEYAREHARHAEFHRVVFRKYYGEGQNIGRWEVLRAAAEEVGLSPDAMQRETESGKYELAVSAQLAEARALGITGVPTYIIDNQYAIVGAYPYEVFEQVMARLEAEERAVTRDGD